MLYLSLTGGAALSLLALPGWERERVSDALVLLTADPRPPFARRLEDLPGERYEIWVGERRVVYGVFKDDSGSDLMVVVFRVI